MFKGIFKPKLSPQESDEAAKKRQQIISDAESMKRLSGNADFIRYCEILIKGKEAIKERLLDKHTFASISDVEIKTLIARVNQIDEDIKIPQKCIWQMENLTEVRDAIKEQARKKQKEAEKHS